MELLQNIYQVALEWIKTFSTIQGGLQVNGQKVDIPSFSVSSGDTIEVKEATSSRQLATRALEDTRIRTVPLWLTRNDDALTATVNREPTADDIETGINVQQIVEFYSR